MSLLEELDAMNKNYDEEPIDLNLEDEVKEPEPVAEEPKEPVAEEPTVEPTEPEPPNEVEQLKQSNAELLARLEALEAKKVEPEPKLEKEKEQPTEPVDINFLTEDDDIDEIVRDVKLFNKLLNKVYSMGVESASNRASEGVLRTIPETVKNNVSTFMALKMASEDFYAKNEDLLPFRKIVASTYEEVASEHSDWTVEECMNETNARARKALNLQQQVKKEENERKKEAPSLPPGSRGRQSRTKPELSKLEQEIAAMNSIED